VPTQDERTDEQLVLALRARAPGAMGSLHERYARTIYSIALRLVRHGHDAEDITQDVLIRAYERLPREREVALRPWLYRLTVNRCYDHLRQAARRRTYPGADELPELASPGDPFERAEVDGLFEAALGALTPRQRAALLLRDVHGLSVAEVGSALAITTGSAEVLLARARTAFRASYRDQCAAHGLPAPAAPALLALPLLALPPALQAPPAVPVPPPSPWGLGGLGASLAAPPALKVAAIVLAAATVTSASAAIRSFSSVEQRTAAPVVERQARDTLPPAAARGDDAAVSPSSAPSAAPSTAPSVVPSAAASAPPSPQASPSPDPTVLSVPSPSPSPSPLPSPPPSPSPQPTPLVGPVPSAPPAPSQPPRPLVDPPPLAP
jgi:RNA polymerase sigma factor (sigma-70 family)